MKIVCVESVSRDFIRFPKFDYIVLVVIYIISKFIEVLFTLFVEGNDFFFFFYLRKRKKKKKKKRNVQRIVREFASEKIPFWKKHIASSLKNICPFHSSLLMNEMFSPRSLPHPPLPLSVLHAPSYSNSLDDRPSYFFARVPKQGLPTTSFFPPLSPLTLSQFELDGCIFKNLYRSHFERKRTTRVNISYHGNEWIWIFWPLSILLSVFTESQIGVFHL